MIRFSRARLGSVIQKELVRRLSIPDYQVGYRRIMAEFQSNAPERMFFHSGRSKVDAIFPNIGFEIQRRRDTWGATSASKDIEFRFSLFVSIKALQGSQGTSTGDINRVEEYIIAISEYVYEILNEPVESLQWLITLDENDVAMATPIRVYDSLAEEISYGHAFSGALRVAQLTWFGKVFRVGEGGGSRGL